MAVLGLGVWIHVTRDSVYTHLVHISTHVNNSTSSLLAANLDSLPYFMMAVGICVTLVGLLGCCGAFTESVGLLCLVSAATSLYG